MNRNMDYEVLCSFLDMPVGDAIKILKISAHTMLKIRKLHGLSKWPFDAIKNSSFRMNWTDVAVIRASQLQRDDLDEDTTSYLQAAERRGWLMRRLYAQKEVNLATEQAVLQTLQSPPYTPTMIPTEAREEPAPCADDSSIDNVQAPSADDSSIDNVQAPSADDQGLFDDFYLDPTHPDNNEPIQWMYQDDDEDEWGILGHGL